MIAAHKTESENEEACDKVRARSAVTIEPTEDTKLMVALTRPGQAIAQPVP